MVLEGRQRIGITDIKLEYERLLDPLKERFWSSELTSAPLMVGEKYNSYMFNEKPLRIMYVGRAMNGWETKWNEGTTKELVEQVFSNSMDMKTISEGIVKDKCGNQIYNYNQSQFWQLCRQLMNLFGIEEYWSDYVAWTNLYKVSPMKSGNPENEIIKKTIKHCANILRREVSYLRPTHIIFVTDSWWYEPKGIDENAFKNIIGVEVSNEEINNENKVESIIVGKGISENFHFSPKVVIIKRPEGKKGTIKDQAQQIFNAFLELENK